MPEAEYREVQAGNLRARVYKNLRVVIAAKVDETAFHGPTIEVEVTIDGQMALDFADKLAGAIKYAKGAY